MTAIADRLDDCVQYLLVVAGCVLLATLWIVGAEANVVLAIVLIWDGLAAVHLLRAIVLMRMSRFAADIETGEDENVPEWVRPARSGRLQFGATIVASAAGLSSGILIVDVDIIADGFDSEVGVLTVLKVSAAAAVVLAWLTLHSGYARHYASLYFRHGQGMSFPGAPTPNRLDFAYFAYTVGTTFATSDVEVHSRVVRHAVLWHSVLSFLYNAAVLGIAISAFTGK